MTIKKVSRKTVAELFQVNPSTVSKWRKMGLPQNEDGSYDLAECVTWTLDRVGKVPQVKTPVIEKAEEEGTRWLNEYRRERATMAKLEREILEGKLLYATDVEKTVFELARRTRDALLNIPARLAAILAAESNRKKMEEMLDLEMRKALEELPIINAKS